jgi:hypothetical protein
MGFGNNDESPDATVQQVVTGIFLTGVFGARSHDQTADDFDLIPDVNACQSPSNAQADKSRDCPPIVCQPNLRESDHRVRHLATRE